MKTSNWIEYRTKSRTPPADWDPYTMEVQIYERGGWSVYGSGADGLQHPAWSPDFAYRYRHRSAGSSSLPEDDTARNELPMFDGLLAYFPNALAYVSTISKIGNDQHNPGEPLHWARGKSTDHLNKIVRHTVDAGKKDARGVRHSGRLAWRALAHLQEELEREEGAPLSRGSTT